VRNAHRISSKACFLAAIVQVRLKVGVKLLGFHEKQVWPDFEDFYVGHHLNVGEILLPAFDSVNATATDGGAGYFEINHQLIDCDSKPAPDDTRGSSCFVERFAIVH
jgi:hypothetical protein